MPSILSSSVTHDENRIHWRKFLRSFVCAMSATQALRSSSGAPAAFMSSRVWSQTLSGESPHAEANSESETRTRR